VTVADLHDTDIRLRTPTFGEYLPTLMAAAGQGRAALLNPQGHHLETLAAR